MSKFTQGTPVSSPLVPGSDDQNTWPTHISKYGQGGFEVVQDIAARDAISDDRRADKAVYVRDTNTWYQFDNKWSEIDMLSVSVKDSTGSNRVDDVSILEFVGATVAPGVDAGKAVVTINQPSPSSGSGSISVTSGSTTYGSVDSIQFDNTTSSSPQNGSVILKPFINASDPRDPALVWNINNISPEWPIKFRPTGQVYEGVESSMSIGLDHGSFEPMHNPSYLAYLSDDTRVFSKVSDGMDSPKGALWFDDVVCNAGSFIQVNKKDKTFGIQDFEEEDPNITDGINYLVAFRVNLRGHAIEDGTVKIFLYRKPFNPSDVGGYLLNVAGHPMLLERQYKKGEALGVIEVMGIVNAKGLETFQCHVQSSFVYDNPVLTDRTGGGSGLLIQALTSTSKTGTALQQFELDTQQNIEMSSHYMGTGLMDMSWLINNLEPVAGIIPNADIVEADGTVVHTFTNADIGKDGAYLSLKDAGSPMDVYFGKVFTAEQTALLIGRDIRVSLTMVSKECPWTIGLFKWNGEPDATASPIYQSRTGNSINLAPGWELVNTLYVSEEPFSDEHTDQQNFWVPAGARNIAVIAYPNVLQTPCSIKIKNFTVDSVTPFLGFAISAPEKFADAQVAFSNEFKRFTKNGPPGYTQRYTINFNQQDGLAMPCGDPTMGNADIVRDPTANYRPEQKVGAVGEGTIKFLTDGTASVICTAQLFSDKPAGTESAVEMWFAKFDSKGVATRIPDSEFFINVGGGVQNLIGKMPEFTIDVKAGDRIGLRASADMDDGAYIQGHSYGTPMVQVDIKFKEPKIPSLTTATWTRLINHDQRVYEFDKVGKDSITLLGVGATANSRIASLEVFETTGNVINNIPIAHYSYDKGQDSLTVNLSTKVDSGYVLVEFWGN